MIGAAAGDIARLHAAARAAQQNAYVPYSGTRIGAAVQTAAAGVFAGCNVENASYGLTICAERVAVFTAVVAEGPSMRIIRVLVIRDDDDIVSPCGACRQVIMQFGRDALINYRTDAGRCERPVDDMLPDVADPDAWRPR